MDIFMGDGMRWRFTFYVLYHARERVKIYVIRWRLIQRGLSVAIWGFGTWVCEDKALSAIHYESTIYTAFPFVYNTSKVQMR